MNVYYAGPVVNNWAEGLWPHAHDLGTPVVAGARPLGVRLPVHRDGRRS